MKLLNIFLIITLAYSGKAQIIMTDSSCDDSTGMGYDLSVISKKLGNLDDSIYSQLRCLFVDYYGFDNHGKLDSTVLRRGAIIVNESVREDLEFVFKELLALKFPINSVIPVNKFGLNRDSSGWNDAASMSANNSSAFNYRRITLSDELSPHAFGTAIDFNPLLNPYEKYVHDGKFIEPENAVYDISKPGTIGDGKIVGIFDQLGWVWGGRWNNPIDYQHFDLRKNRSRKHYLMKESSLKLFFSFSENGDSLSLYDSKIDRKMNKASLTLQKSDFKAFEACIDSFGIDCPGHWKNKKVVFDSMTKETRKLSGLNIEICIDEKSRFKRWNSYCARLLVNKLKGVGVNAFFENSEKLKVNLRIFIDLGTADFKVYDNFQVIYVPGAFKENAMNISQGRFDFLNLLISEDLPNATKIASKVQQSIFEKMKIKPLNRQLTGPNKLQDECIKTDFDGIYCRNLAFFSGHYCPQIYISLLSMVKAEGIFIQPELGFEFCESLAESILDGILQSITK